MQLLGTRKWAGNVKLVKGYEKQSKLQKILQQLSQRIWKIKQITENFVTTKTDMCSVLLKGSGLIKWYLGYEFSAEKTAILFYLEWGNISSILWQFVFVHWIHIPNIT